MALATLRALSAPATGQENERLVIMSEHSTLYEFLRDQGSFIGGAMALMAGLLLYFVGRRQAQAVEAQNRQLRRDKSRHFARECLIAGRLLDGILERVAANIDRLNNFGNDPFFPGEIGHGETNRIRQTLQVPPLYPILAYLGQFNTEAISAYYQLCGKIEEFRMPTGATSSTDLERDLESIRAVQRHCREEITDDMARANRILHDTQEG